MSEETPRRESEAILNDLPAQEASSETAADVKGGSLLATPPNPIKPILVPPSPITPPDPIRLF